MIKCFQCALALNYGEIELDSERASNIKPFMNKLETGKE